MKIDHLINGQRVAGSDYFETRNPATQEVLAEVASGGEAEVNAAVAAAKELKAQAEEEGLDVIFREAGFDWREPGCSMCLGMNPDRLAPGERCASTSNRNFEGRQGRGGRTHLVSPQLAAATAIAGHFVDPRELVATA